MGKIIRLEEGSNYMITKGAILIEKAQIDMVKDILKEKGIAFDSYETPLESFYMEETKWRIHTGYDVSSLTYEQQDKLAEDIADELFDAELVFDSDFISDTVRKHVDLVDSELSEDEE